MNWMPILQMALCRELWSGSTRTVRMSVRLWNLHCGVLFFSLDCLGLGSRDFRRHEEAEYWKHGIPCSALIGAIAALQRSEWCVAAEFQVAFFKWVKKGQEARVKHQAWSPIAIGSRSVQRVTEDGMPECLHVDTQLM